MRQLGKNRSPWKATDQLIIKWLQDRQSVLILYNELCQMPANTEQLEQMEKTEQAEKNNSEYQKPMIQSFCQRLMDYISMGHFKIFEKLADAEASCSSTRGELDKNLMTRVLNSTIVALDFNDHFQEYLGSNQLSEHLSKLGQELAHRMDCEDKLIKHYLEVTSEVLNLSAASF